MLPKIPFPPSALNLPKETLKVKVRQDISLASLMDEWYTWLTNIQQDIYNRVEFKYKGIYVVLAKLKPESEKDD